MKTRLSKKLQKTNSPRMTHKHTYAQNKKKPHKNTDIKTNYVCFLLPVDVWNGTVSFPYIHWLFTQMHTQTRCCSSSRRDKCAPDGRVNVRSNCPPGRDWYTVCLSQRKGRKEKTKKVIVEVMAYHLHHLRLAYLSILPFSVTDHILREMPLFSLSGKEYNVHALKACHVLMEPMVCSLHCSQVKRVNRHCSSEAVRSYQFF